MNKLIIPIIVILIIAAGIGGFIFQTPAFPEPSLSQKPKEEISKDSPFGAHGAFSRPFVESDKVSYEEILRKVPRSKKAV